MNRRVFLKGILSLPFFAPFINSIEAKEEEIWDTDYIYVDINCINSPIMHEKFYELNGNIYSHRGNIIPYLNGKPLFLCQQANTEKGEATCIDSKTGERYIVKGKIQLFTNNPNLISCKPKHYPKWEHKNV